MADTKKILEGLQIIVTDLAQQADGHATVKNIRSSGLFKAGREVC